MEIQTFEHGLQATLINKSGQSSAYKKALTIYNSILESSEQIPNFRQNMADSDSNFALFIFGSVFKILMKDSPDMRHNLQSLLLLINQALPHLNVSIIKMNNLIQQLKQKTFSLIKQVQSQQKTPLMLRFAVSILSYTLINTDNIQKNKKSCDILCAMFEYAVQSHRTNILSKQSSKMLTHLVKNNSNIAVILSRYANLTMLSNIESNLYLNNVRQVIAEFPRQQINDIGYRVTKHISGMQCNTDDEQTYLTQTYFFLQKLMNKFSSSTLEQICKELINNVPSSAQQQSKVMFCYLQALHSALEGLVTMNQNTANKNISAVVSIVQQFITKGGRIEKQAISILRSIMTSCIRKSLWIGKQSYQQLDFLGLQNMAIQNDENKSHNFGKVVCMLQSMLSDQYTNYRGTASILSAFFDSLDTTALQGTFQLIQKIVQFRQNFDDKSFKNIMHALFGSMTIQNICKIYQMSVHGDIADPNFQGKNNLWLAYCTQKYEGQQNFNTFMTYYFPLLNQFQKYIDDENIHPVRKQGYKALKQMFWRCLKVFCRKANPNYNYQQLVIAIKNQIPVGSDSVLDHISIALQYLCISLNKSRYQCAWAGNLISLLAKNLSIEKSNSKQILNAMKYLSVIAQKQYLNRVFDKNITKLIEQKNKGVLSSNDHIDNNLKNLQILIAVSNGINFHDPSVLAPFQISRQELVIKLISETIAQNTLFQKKSYKYILQTIPLMGKGYTIEVVDLLDTHQHKIMAASKHYRMSILAVLWDQVSQNDDALNESFEFIKKYLPQIMIDMREPNQRTRKTANSIFNTFCTKLNDLGLIQNFIEMMCAGLATDSTQMKVATLNALALVFTKKYDIDFQFSVSILEIVLMLLYQKNGEIFKAIVEYCRRFIFSIEKSQSAKAVTKTILEQLFKVDVQSKLQYRSIVKHFLLKLVKKFDRQSVENMIPIEDRKILSNAIKTENRQKRKKKQKKAQRRAEIQRIKAQNEKSSSEGQDDQNNDEEVQDQNAMQQQENQQLKQLKNSENLLLKYDLDKQNFHFQEQKLNIKTQLKKAKREQNKQGDDVTFGQNGMMIVREESKRTRQRKRDIGEEEGQQNLVAQSYLNVKKKRKLNDVHVVKQSGQTFKSKRAGGDVKQKDKPEPYAFIQFNSKALNKRFKKRAQKVFDDIFEKHQGGLKGIKSSIARKH